MTQPTRNTTNHFKQRKKLFTYSDLVYECLNLMPNGATKYEIMKIAQHMSADIKKEQLGDRIYKALMRDKRRKNKRFVEVNGKWHLIDSYSEHNVSSVKIPAKSSEKPSRLKYRKCISYPSLIEQFLKITPNGATKLEIQRYVKKFHPNPTGRSESYVGQKTIQALERQKIVKIPICVEIDEKWFLTQPTNSVSMVNIDETLEESNEHCLQEANINKKLQEKSEENECCSKEYTNHIETNGDLSRDSVISSSASKAEEESLAPNAANVPWSSSILTPVIKNFSSCVLDTNNQDFADSHNVPTAVNSPMRRKGKDLGTIDMSFSSDEEDQDECIYISTKFIPTIDLTIEGDDMCICKCPCCGDSFESDEKLGRHVKIHRANPYNCSLDLTAEELKFLLLLRQR